MSTSKFLKITEDTRLLADYNSNVDVTVADDFVEVITSADACEFVEHVESRLGSIRELKQASPDEPSNDGDTPTHTDTEDLGRK